MAPPQASCSEPPRWVGKDLVYRTDEDARTFILRPQKVNGVVTTRRVYGTVESCQECSNGFFRRVNAHAQFCSNKCSKKGARNPTRRRSQKNMTVTADKTYSLVIRAGATCVECGKSDHLQCAHGFSRRYRAVRWDLRNAFPLCRGCHVYFTHRPLEWDEWLRSRWGDELYAEIREQALRGPLPDMPSLIADLRALLDPRKKAA